MGTDGQNAEVLMLNCATWKREKVKKNCRRWRYLSQLKLPAGHYYNLGTEQNSKNHSVCVRLCTWFCTLMFSSFATEYKSGSPTGIINDWTGLKVPKFDMMTCQRGAGGKVQKVSFSRKRAPLISFLLLKHGRIRCEKRLVLTDDRRLIPLCCTPKASLRSRLLCEAKDPE